MTAATTGVLLGLGANLGDRADNLRAALSSLRQDVDVTAWSSLYETAPMYVTEQPRFLNIVVRGDTRLAPIDLLRAIKGVEQALGRRSGLRYGPRPIDIDILFYGDTVLETADLTVPHPRMAERPFVLVPAAEIAPGWRHPVTGEIVAQMAAALAGAGEAVRRVGPMDWPGRERA